MILIALMSARIPSGPDNFKRVIKCQTFQTSVYGGFESVALYPHLRLILGEDPFKVIRLW